MDKEQNSNEVNRAKSTGGIDVRRWIFNAPHKVIPNEQILSQLILCLT